MKDISKLNSKRKTSKSYEIYYDKTSERYVFEIFDEALVPLLIKCGTLRPRELEITRNQKLHLN